MHRRNLNGRTRTTSSVWRLARLNQREVAIASLRRAMALKPDLADGWRALGDQLVATGDSVGADSAYAQQIKASTKDPRLLAAAAAFV